MRGEYDEYKKSVSELLQIAQKRPLTKKQQDLLMILLAMMRMICDSPSIIKGHDCQDYPKLDELARVLDEALSDPDVKVIIFSEWEGVLDGTESSLASAKLKRGTDANIARLQQFLSIAPADKPADKKAPPADPVLRDPTRAAGVSQLFHETDWRGHMPRLQVLDESTWSALQQLAESALTPEQLQSITVLRAFAAKKEKVANFLIADALHLACAAEHGFTEVHSNDRQLLASPRLASPRLASPRRAAPRRCWG